MMKAGMRLLLLAALCAAAPLNTKFDKSEITKKEDMEEGVVVMDNREGKSLHALSSLKIDDTVEWGKYQFSFRDFKISNSPFSVIFGNVKVTKNQDTDSGWSGWSGFGPCSATCGLATKRRERTCHGGAQCPGADQEIVECILADCATTTAVTTMVATTNKATTTKAATVKAASTMEPTTTAASTMEHTTTAVTTMAATATAVSTMEPISTAVLTMEPTTTAVTTMTATTKESLPMATSTIEPTKTAATTMAATTTTETMVTTTTIAVGCSEWPWAGWTECSATCGNGVQTRQRYEDPENIFSFSKCKGVEFQQLRGCNEQSCTADCDGQIDCCKPPNKPCGLGEGFCEDDNECELGLVCGVRSNAKYCLRPEGHCSGTICSPVLPNEVATPRTGHAELPNEANLPPVDNVVKSKNKIIQYVFTSETSPEDQEAFRRAMDEIESKTCFIFKEQVYAVCDTIRCLEIKTGSESCSTGCRGLTFIFERNSVKRILLISLTQVNDTNECESQCQGFILHELMHVLGVGHTFTRSDRDEYIIVHDEIVQEHNKEMLFEICEGCEWYDTPYDCDSIMHYGTHITDDKEIMTPKDNETCKLEKWGKLVPSSGDWNLLTSICESVDSMPSDTDGGDDQTKTGIRTSIKGLEVTVQKIYMEIGESETHRSKRRTSERITSQENIDEGQLGQLLDPMYKAAGYLRTYCGVPWLHGGIDINCESDKISEYTKKLQDIYKQYSENTDTIKSSSGFLSSFIEKKELLQSKIIISELFLNAEPKYASVCTSESGCSCGAEVTLCKKGEICAEDRCLKGCDVTDILTPETEGIQYLEDDCYCNKNGGEICPREFEADKTWCNGANVCHEYFGCTEVCPLFYWILWVG